MKLAADFLFEGLFVRVEKVERNQDQHDSDNRQDGLERWTQEEIEAQTESFLFSGDRVELIQ